MAIHSLVGFDELNLDESPAEHKLDFDSWIILISNVEKKYSDDINKLSLVYDSFLSEFPLCCGYWIKYAAHRARLCCVEEVIRVYEKAVESASFSVDLWVDYCSFAISVFEDPFDVCRLFRRGLSFIGKDYLCHALWDKYIDFEFSQKHWTSLAQIYIEVLKFPTKKLHQYYESFKKLVTIWGEETGCHGDSIVKLQPETGIGGEFTAPAIDEVSFVIKDLLEPSTRFEALKNYISIGAHLYLKASELDLKILGFEKNMLRTYFDMKPLDDDQLENWHHYLDFVEMNGDFEWAVKLYERCLIPCASYSEFWMRYVEYAESKGGREIANDALERATRLFLKDLPAIHLFNAGLKEQIGDISGAHSAFLHFDMHSKSSFIDYAMRRANMEKRLGNNIAACNVYREALAVATKEMPNSLPMLYIQFSRLQYMVSNCVDAARDILIDGIQNMASCKLLWEELINLALNHEAARQINILDPIFANAIMPGTDVSRSLSYKDRLDISELYMKFIDLCGNIYESRRAWNRHIKLFPHTLRAYSKRTESVRAFSREKILTDGADGTAVNKKEVTRTDEMNPMIQLSADDAENFKDVPDEDDTCRSDEGNKKVLCAAAYIDPTENDNSNNICHIQKEELHVSGRDERPLLDVLSLNEPVNEPHNLASSVDHGCPSHREASRSNSMLEFEQSIKPHPGSSLPNAKFNNSGQGYCECPTNASTPSLWSPQCSEDHKDLESSHRSSKRQDSIKYSGERKHKKWSVSPPRCGSPQPSDSFLHSLSCRSPWSSVELQGEEHSHSPPRQHFSLDGSRGLQSYLRHRQNRPMYNNYSGGRRVQNERRGPSSYTRRGRHVLNQRSTHTSQLQPPGQAGGYLSGHTVDYSLQSNEQHPNMQSDQACNQMLQYCYYQQQLMHLQQQSYPNLPQQPVQPPQQLRQPHPQLQSQQQLQSQANQMQLLQFQYQQMQLQYQMQQPLQEASKQAQAHGDEHDESQTQHSQLHGDVQTQQQQQQQQLYQQMQIQQQPEQLHPAGDAQQQQHQMQLQQQMQAYQYQQQYILYLQQCQQQQQLFPAGKENQNGLNLQWEQQLPQTPCEQQDGDQENEGASSQMKS